MSDEEAQAVKNRKKAIVTPAGADIELATAVYGAPGQKKVVGPHFCTSSSPVLFLLLGS